MRLHRFRRRSDALLAVVDSLVVLVTALLAFGLRFESESVPDEFVQRYVVLTAVLFPVWVTSAYATGLYKRAVLRPGTDHLQAAFSAALASGAVLLVINSALLGGDASRAWIGLVVLGLLLLGLGARRVLGRLRRALVPFGIALERYAIYGDGPVAQRLHGDLTRASGAPFVVTELLPEQLEPADLRARASASRIDGLIVPAGRDPKDISRLATILSEAGIEVLLAPELGDLDLRVASLAMLHGVPLLRVAGASPRRRARRQGPSKHLQRGVAVLGTRGVPANYGGFETFAERLSLHMVEREVPVTVYCRRHYATQEASWRGIRLTTLPTIRSKYLDTVVHTLLSVVHLAVRTRIRDVVLCNAANAVALPLLRLTGRRVVMNVDGLEWRRGKWGVAGRSWYRAGEWLSVRFASVLVTDAEEVRTYYRVRHDSDSVMIPYGADPLPRGLPLPRNVPVQPDRYLLYVSRWERENNPVLVAAAHRDAGAELPLVMLGQATYDSDLDAEVQAAAGPGAHLPGTIFGEGYQGLQSNALAYIHATEVGGTHPALIEAMGAGNLCLVLDTPENREVAGAVAWMFRDQADLSAAIRRVAALQPEEVAAARDLTRRYARERYSWSTVGDAYLELLRD